MEQSTLHRKFRNLTPEQIADPDQRDVFESMGLGGQVGWDDLLDVPRVLIVSAAGAGKTHECREQANRLFAEGKAAFFLTLEGVANNELQLLLDRVELERCRQWAADGHSVAHFFLDSADELLLSHGNFRQALRKLALAIDGNLHRARIVVTCRPIGLDIEAFAHELPYVPPPPGPKILDDPNEPFRRLISGHTRKEHHEAKKKPDDDGLYEGVRLVGLTSLDRPQVEALAALRGVTNVPALITEIDRKRAWDFARRPQELIEICSYWTEHGRLGTRSEQVTEDIRRKLRETGNRTRHMRLSEAKALEGAERLALAQVLTRKRTIRFSDLSLDTIETEAAIDPTVILEDWSSSERAELLQRPLFGPASYGRVRFQHRSASEFLAARRLHRLNSKGHMPRRALFRLFFGECYGQALLFPSMRAVAAWLAIWNENVRDEVLRREPEALMDDGDPESFAISTRSQILSEYVARYGQDDWRGVRIPYPQVLRFASPDLSPTVRRLWETGATSPEVCELLIDLIQAGRMADCLDIASAVANDVAASHADRVTAVTALSEMSAAGDLDPLTTSLISDPHWPSTVKEGVVGVLFPKHMSEGKFVELLGQIESDENRIGGVEWTLPRLIPSMQLNTEQASRFRSALAQLIRSGIETVEQWPHFGSQFSHYSSALAVLCMQELVSDHVPPDDLIDAAVLATRLRQSEYGDEKPIKRLAEHFHRAPRSWQRAVYIAEGRFCAAYVPNSKADEFAVDLAYGTLVAPLDYGDFDWLFEIGSDPEIDRRTRASAFWDAMSFLQRDGVRAEKRISALRDLAATEPGWTEKLESRLQVPKRNAEFEAREAKWKKQAEEAKAKEQADIESWVSWRDEVLRDPDAYFARTDTAQIVWDFSKVLERSPEAQGWRAHWNRATLEEHFTPDIVARASTAFCAYWRTISVPLRSERADGDRNSIWTHWVHALAGVYAEAETSGWAEGLTANEADRAARLAPVEMDGIPPWVKDLVVAQPEIVDATLGRELSAQLDDAVSFAFPGLIADFARADRQVADFFEPRVWSWLNRPRPDCEDEQQQARLNDHVERAIDYVLHSAREDAALAALATKMLERGLDCPNALLWLMALLSIAPDRGLELMEGQIGKLDPVSRYNLSEALFATFSDRRGARFCPDLSDPRFTPELLFRLVRQAYAVIRISEDINRAGTGTYSPTPRDEAQHGRSAVLGALLSRTGPVAWQIKQAMRDDPLFAHFRDRLDQVAREKAAQEAEGVPLSDNGVIQVEKHGEAPQGDRNGMFQIMIDRLADLQHDIAAHEFSERSILRSIEQEKDMQIWFAKRLQECANGAYRIDREAMVINAKETDIRLLSVQTEAQAVIELKLANNGYSLTDLRSALEAQLVGQYMQHERCRAGCLLITMNRVRHWRCPETSTTLDFEAVLSLLQLHARKLEERMNHEVRLAVIGIDLTG